VISGNNCLNDFDCCSGSCNTGFNTCR
jgi:hypothetical protein